MGGAREEAVGREGCQGEKLSLTGDCNILSYVSVILHVFSLFLLTTVL